MSDLAMKRAEAFLAAIRTSDMPGLGPSVRASRQSAEALDEVVSRFCDGAGATGKVRDGFRSAALLWHDHLDLSHTLSQGIPTADGSFLHGIMHRREPDFMNAAYWFRRVGEHAVYPALARAVTERLQGRQAEDLLGRLVVKGRWDPFAFIDACEGVAEVGDETLAEHLREVQAIEFEQLVQGLAGSL